MRANKTVLETQKNYYPKCNLKKQHQKQAMNLVCLTSTCKLKGPICLLCKKQHVNHNVISIKTFLTNIEDSLRKIQPKKQISQNQKIQQKHQKQTIQRIQQNFHQIMAMLKLQVLELSEEIYKIQDRFIKEYEQIKLSILKQNQKQQTIKQFLTIFKQIPSEDGIQFRTNINALIKSLTFNKNQILIKSDEDQIINTYTAKVQIYKENIFNIQNQLKLMFESIHQKASIDKIKINRPKTAFPTTGTASNPNKNLVFSSILKAPNIILEKQGTIAKLKDNNGEKIVFVNNALSLKNSQISIKIIQIKGPISFGVALKDKVKQKAYKFQKNSIGHGAFLLASNSLKYNNNQKNQNGTNSNINFVAGDQIEIHLDNKLKKISFTCTNDQKKFCQLNLKNLSQNLWKQLEFCVVLSSTNDKVQII